MVYIIYIFKYKFQMKFKHIHLDCIVFFFQYIAVCVFQHLIKAKGNCVLCSELRAKKINYITLSDKFISLSIHLCSGTKTVNSLFELDRLYDSEIQACYNTYLRLFKKKSHTNQSTLNVRTHTSTHKQKLALKVTQFRPIQACTDTDTFASFVYDFIIKNKAKAGKPKSSLNLTNTVCKLNAYKSSANFNDPHTQL